MSTEDDSLHQGDDHVAATANSDTKTGDSPSTQKRKAPSPHPSEMTTSQSPKRTKRDDHDYGGSSRRGSTATTRSPTAPRQISPVERRASASMEEKKRGKRLFGGLLNTLSQTTTNSQQQRRQEIERRQQEKATHQRAEDSKHREVKLARIREVRQREQIKFEEQVKPVTVTVYLLVVEAMMLMRTRHSHLVASARFLRTKTEPRIYYLPWDLTERQEYRIKDQVQDAEDLIGQETREFKQRKDKRLGIVSEEKHSPPGDEMVIDETSQPPTVIITTTTSSSRPTGRASATADHSSKAGGSHAKEADKAGDVMVDEGEDTVIY
ncbi:hypothetical protein PG999_010899 [Apiospora kogelbergensis]|uniref:Pinin/SDK/MemA protein domain-containing protein n=1 Tax=Apiospora kogelbergensis TaxID=1337665 RepID=A0AAW0QBG6_9PEZI